MKINFVLATVALFDVTVSAAAVAVPIPVPNPDVAGLTSVAHRERDETAAGAAAVASVPEILSDLWKRRGGGASGGRGGSSSSSGGSTSGSGSSSSGSSGSSSGSSSSSGKSGSSSSSSSSSGSSGRGSSSSSTGGRTTTGSGVAASYGGGRYYGGGTTVPYRAGTRSTAGITPILFVGAALAFWPGVWLHGAYLYPYGTPWRFYNSTTAQNETKPVQCGCDETVECGCDENNSTEYINSVLGDGSYNQLNKSLVTVANVNGTDTILLNGTLPNGTTASGGSESASAGVGLRRLAEVAGWWPLVATTFALVVL